MMTGPFSATTWFNASCEPSRQKVEDFLTGFTTLTQLPQFRDDFGKIEAG